MIKEGLIRQATGVQLLMNAMERTLAKELPGLMQHLQKEFGPVGVSSHSAAPAASTSRSTSTLPTSMTASAAPAPPTTPKATIKAEHGDPFQVQPISQCKVEGDMMSYMYKCPLCDDPTTATINACRACINRHLGRALLCTVCSWSSYNPDTLKRHMRNKHS